MVAAIHVLLDLADVDARHEAQIGAEAFAAIDVLQVVKVVAVPGGDAGVEGIASGMGSRYIDGLAGHGLRGEDPDGIELDARIDRSDAIVAAGEFAVRDEESGARLFGELTLHAEHADFRVPAVVGIGEAERRGPAARSSTARNPRFQRPSLPVSRAPYSGSTIWREKNRFSGVTKKPLFSMKNARFSGN